MDTQKIKIQTSKFQDQTSNIVSKYPFDIIIPVLNEEKVLLSQKQYFQSLSDATNLIFVDGGSQDNTIAIARSYGEVFSSPKGRGPQKNLGASKSTAPYLLFMHIDTQINEEALNSIFKAIQDGVRVGCFSLQIDDPRFIFRIYEFVVNFRAKYFQVFDGDCGLLIQHNTFDQIGTFDPIAVMEDIMIGKRIRKVASTHILQIPIMASSRKWQSRGFMLTFFEYLSAYVRYWTGKL